MIEELNKYIEEYINNYSLKEYPELINYVRKLTKIILDNPPVLEDKEYLLDIKLQTSQKLAMEFLEHIGINFNDLLVNNLGTLNIKFKHFSELNKDDDNISYADYENGKLDVNIIYYEDLSDCYTIIHELLHASNVVVEDDLAKKIREMLTETVSLLGTVEAEKYFLDTRYNEEFRINKMDDYYGILENASKAKDNLKLIDIYLQNGSIKEEDLVGINEDSYEEIIINKEVQIPYYERYLLAYVLTNYIEKTYDGKTVLKRINKMLKTNTIEEIFLYLKLDFDILKSSDGVELITDISDYSLEKLEKSLKEESKKI